MKKILLLILMFGPVFALAQNKHASPATFDVIIGTYTNGSSKGIYVYRFYEQNGRMAFLNEIDDISNPSYLCVTGNNRFVYAVNENNKGGVSSFTFEPKTGKLVLLNQQETQGADPCYVAVDKEQRNMFIANYSGGSLAVFPINKDGSIGALSQLVKDSGSSVVKDRQQGPHVHMAMLSPNEKYLLYTDLGTDKLNVMRYKASKTPPLSPADPAFAGVTPGAGPRHLVFSADGKFVFLLQEIGGIITTFGYDNGKLTRLDTADMKIHEFMGNIGSAAIHLSPDGRFLYASNRGNANNITQYAINPDNGHLTFVSRVNTVGRGPRDFMIDPTGKYLIIANQIGNNIVVYKLNPTTGVPSSVVSQTQIDSPVCLKIVPAE